MVKGRLRVGTETRNMTMTHLLPPAPVQSRRDQVVLRHRDARPGRTDARGIPAGLPWQLVSFATIGVVSTLAYAMLFWSLSIGLSAQKANLVALLHLITVTPALSVELVVLVLANLVAIVLRFLLMRVWVFRQRRFHNR